MTIADRFAQALKYKGVSRYMVSKETGVDAGRLSRLLSGEVKKPSKKNLQKLAEYFNVAEEWLLYGTGKGLPQLELMNDDDIARQDKEVAEGICIEYAIPQQIVSHPAYIRLLEKVGEQANTIDAQRETINAQRKYIIELERQLSDWRNKR